MRKKLEKKVEILKNKVDKFIEDKKKKNQYIKPYDIETSGSETFYNFYVYPTSKLLNEVSNHYLTVKNYKKSSNKDYIPVEKTEHTRKKTFVYDFNGSVQKVLTNNLLNIYRQQKITFKLTI